MSVRAPIKAVLLDIEGTLCSISFVRDVMFPYSLEALPRVISTEWDSPVFRPYRDAFPEEYRDDKTGFEAHVRALVGDNSKVSYLKGLQGYLWAEGYRSGFLRAPLYPDVAPAVAAWRAEGVQVLIYSSGSVEAQKLFFAHTNVDPADLTGEISGWFDTVNAGPKTESTSYEKIAAQHPAVPLAQWLFLTDLPAEASAATGAGMQSLLVVRPGNAPLPSNHALTSTAINDLSGLRALTHE